MSLLRFSLLTVLLCLSACASKSMSDDEHASLHILWQVDVDHRVTAQGEGLSKAAITADHIIIAGQDAYARVFDFSGHELGRIALDAPCQSAALALSPTVVIIADVVGGLYALDIQHMRRLWKRQLSNVVYGKPQRLNDGFVVQAADNTVYAFSASGEQRWLHVGIAPVLGMQLSSSPRVDGNTVYTVMNNGDLLALNAQSGDIIWKQQLLLDAHAHLLSELPMPIAHPIRIRSSLIIPFYQGSLKAVSIHTGKLQWSRDLSLKAAPLQRANDIVVSTTTGDVLALNPANGDTLWRKHLSDDAELTGPIAIGKYLFVAASDGSVYLLSSDGTVLEQMVPGGRIDVAPMPASTGFLLRDNLGRMFYIQP